MLDNFDYKINFWELEPQFKAAGKFKEIYDKDKSKGKNKSSLLMWTVAMCWDMNSRFYNLPEDGDDSKIDLLFEDIYGSKKYFYDNQADVMLLREQYIKMQDTNTMRALRDIEIKLDERSRFLKMTPYELGTCNERGTWVGNTSTMLDKMMADTKKIFDQYDAAKKAVDAERIANEEVKGGGKVSLGDNEQI